MILRIVLFLVLNFGALAIGGFFTGQGVPSDWYANLNKAPWTPPGWVFGAAWTTIMVCFSIYMAKWWELSENESLLMALFAVQWVLNVAWNPAFFYLHWMGIGLLIIIALNILVGYLLFSNRSALGFYTWLVAPYFAWLLIATSLNAYAWAMNG